MRVLNVGGGGRYLPPQYDGWEQTLLDIDPAVKPDICGDSVHLKDMEDEAGKYDAVYSSHCLEHFYKHDVPVVLRGFIHALNAGGYADISVPNLANLLQELRQRNHDICDVWYRTGSGIPITFHDVLYGWDAAMSNGNLYYAHRCGFTPTSLNRVLYEAGFAHVEVCDQGANLFAKAYKTWPH